ncbi:MAG: FtsX-like permease family protein, partial [Bacteroidota bacterium]
GIVTHFSNISAPLTGVWTEHGDLSWEGMDESIPHWFCSFFVDPVFGQTIDWEIVKGRDFSEELRSDSTSLIINEAAAAYMQMENPIGQKIEWHGDYRIIGVVKNVLMESPFSEVRPTVYAINRGDMSNFQLLKLNPNVPTLEAISKIESIHKEILRKVPFSFNFIDDLHARKFKKIERLGNISKVFATLAIFISCLGLLGLAAYMVEQRTKEISIRKVLGASIPTLLKMLSKEFVMMVLISSAIAIPIGFLGMNKWLNNYEYRVSINWWVLLLAAGGILVITIVTVSLKSLGVVSTNPAKILKNE